MQKLLYITTNLQGSGGVSRILSVRLNYLVQAFGYQVYIINTTGNSNSMFYHIIEAIQITSFNNDKTNISNIFLYKKALKNAINNINPDIIVNCDNGLKGALLPYFINTKARLVYEMHSSKDMVFDRIIDNLKFKLSKLIVQKSIKKYNRFVVLTENHAKEWKGNNIQIIPNPITIPLSTFNCEKQKIVLAVGRFSLEKGYERLLNIWSKISVLYPEWKLEIYGAGDKNKYIGLLENLNILETVVLKDAVDNIEEVYVTASFLVNTSFSEAFPLTIVEAMYYGLPVIAFETIGAKQLILNEDNGYLIEQNDESTFAEKIKILIRNEEKLLLMSNKAIKSVQKYNLDSIMKQWLKLYNSLI